MKKAMKLTNITIKYYKIEWCMDFVFKEKGV